MCSQLPYYTEWKNWAPVASHFIIDLVVQAFLYLIAYVSLYS